MTKSLKIFLSVLALISVGLSLSIIFGWNPFAKKEKETFTEESLVQPSPTEVPSIESILVVLEKEPIFSLPVEEEYFNDLYSYSFDGTSSGEEKVFLGFFLDSGVEIKAIFKGNISNITEYEHGKHPWADEADFVQIWIEREDKSLKASYMFIGEALVEEGDTLEEGAVIARAEEGALNFAGRANLSLALKSGDGAPVGISEELFDFTK
jgi:hypothetical protein